MSGLEENTGQDEILQGEETAEVQDDNVQDDTDQGDDDDLLNIGQERVLELISYLVVNLVENPDDVTVDVVRRQDRDVYQVRVNEADLGKVIGKGGQTAQAMRVLLTAVSAHTDQRIGLEIVE